MLDAFANVSFTEKQLLPAREEEAKFIIKKIIDKKIIKKQVYYLIWWKGYLKKDSTWESKKSLLEDIGDDLLELEFEYQLTL
jgi:hypothetical protein